MGTPDPDTSRTGSSSDAGTYEKWLVRILLTLAFGLAFGIEGMTLLRSYLFYGEEAQHTEQAAESRRQVLQEGDVLVPIVGRPVRVRRLRVQATDESWTFTLVARPDSGSDQPLTLTFPQLTASNGSAHTSAPTHTWAPGDTTSFKASWALPVGQRPDGVTVSATTPVLPDSTASATRSYDIGHVPVRMQ